MYFICLQGGTGSPCQRLCAKLHSALASGWQKVSSCVVMLKYIYFQALIISSCCLCLCNKARQCLKSEKTKHGHGCICSVWLLYRCQGDGWSAYSERTGFHKLLQKQTFESDVQPEKQEQPVNAMISAAVLSLILI